MKIIKSLLGTALIILSLSFTMSCQRSGGEISDDVKTASRYVNRGFQALFGQKKDSRQISYQQEFTGPMEEDFVPLEDNDIYRQLSLGDPKILEDISVHSALPQSKKNPGDPGSTIPGVEKFHSPEEMQLGAIFPKILFSYNDYSTNNNSSENIKKIAQYMKANPSLYLFVEGHCDERGSSSYNLALGSRRSNSVRNMLIKEGVPLDNIFTISYGKERPLIINHDETAWSQNRRAEFKLFVR